MDDEKLINDGELNLDSSRVLTSAQEMTVINQILVYKDCTKAAKNLGLEKETVNSVCWKYRDIIALVLYNEKIEDIVQTNYEKSISLVLEANLKAIKLLCRQIDILSEEFDKPENKGIVIKDYLIQQVLVIQDKLQKIVDSNNIKFKDNRTFLEKRIAGLQSIDEELDTGNYAVNQEAVYEKLVKIREQHIQSRIKATEATYVGIKAYNSDGTLYKSWKSITHAANDGFGSRSAINRAAQRCLKESDYLFKGEYKVVRETPSYLKKKGDKQNESK